MYNVTQEIYTATYTQGQNSRPCTQEQAPRDMQPGVYPGVYSIYPVGYVPSGMYKWYIPSGKYPGHAPREGHVVHVPTAQAPGTCTLTY